jgi:hypothetical protein
MALIVGGGISFGGGISVAQAPPTPSATSITTESDDALETELANTPPSEEIITE